jgi:tetratricopeptide (TPR) repeat protein
MSIEPTDSTSCWGIGLACFRMEDWEKSLFYLRQYMRFSPGDIDAYAYIAASLYQKGNYTEQINTYNSILSYNRKLPWVYCMKANALCFLGQFQEALANFDKATELKPDYAEAFYLKSRVLAYFRQKDQAMESLKKAIELDHSYSEESWDDDLLNNLKLFSEFKEITHLSQHDEVEEAWVKI